MMKRWLLGGIVVYVTTIVVGAFGAAVVPASARNVLRSSWWLLGPAANLVHGTHFLWPFAIGTIAVAGLFLGFVRSRSRAVKASCATAFALAWVAFGFLAYAPGA